MKLYQSIAISLITMTLAGYAFAGGDHVGQHVSESSTSTCTPEHEKMGHCKMESGEVPQDESHVSTVGQPAEASAATKTVNVNLLDSMKFEFVEPLDIKDGDIVKFVITNKGKLAHEFSLGSESEQEAHREMMKQMPGMVHTDSNIVTVQPGETNELVWQFLGKNQVVFACNVPGHFEAGMHHEVEVQ
jgi:uncharacterized cupredoxin-like copper-binding protein